MLKDRVTLISGAATGIGEAIARLLASQGAHTYLLDRDQDGCRRVAESSWRRALRARRRCAALRRDCAVVATRQFAIDVDQQRRLSRPFSEAEASGMKAGR